MKGGAYMNDGIEARPNYRMASRGYQTLSGECLDRNHGDCADESCQCSCHREDHGRDEDDESP